jgi:hypothetical protein
MKFTVSIHVDLEEAARLLSPAQLQALLTGIAQVIAAQQSPRTR